jgi:hydrogenase maturation protease
MGVTETEVAPLQRGMQRGHPVGSAGSSDWRAQLRDTVADVGTAVHLVGVGNELRADDAVGLEIVSALRSRLGPAKSGVEIHGCSPSPERLLARLALSKGRIVVFDAVEASADPGEVVFRPMGDTRYGFFGTHNIPLKLVPGLSERLSDVYLVGVQPASLEVGVGLSDAVRKSVNQIVAVVAEGVERRA